MKELAVLAVCGCACAGATIGGRAKEFWLGLVGVVSDGAWEAVVLGCWGVNELQNKRTTGDDTTASWEEVFADNAVRKEATFGSVESCQPCQGEGERRQNRKSAYSRLEYTGLSRGLGANDDTLWEIDRVTANGRESLLKPVYDLDKIDVHCGCSGKIGA